MRANDDAYVCNSRFSRSAKANLVFDSNQPKNPETNNLHDVTCLHGGETNVFDICTCMSSQLIRADVVLDVTIRREPTRGRVTKGNLHYSILWGYRFNCERNER